MNNGKPRQLKAIGQNILVQLLPPSDTTEGGLHLPDDTKERMRMEARVVSVGSGMATITGDRIAPEVKVGDRIWAQLRVKIEVGREVYYCIRENEIYAVEDTGVPDASLPAPDKMLVSDNA